MTRQEKLRAQVIGMCVKGKMTVREGAERLQLSERQVKNLKARHKIGGAGSMMHRNCGRQPAHTLKAETRQKVVELKRTAVYEGANFTHFREILEEKHGIQISYTALRTLLVSNGIKSPKTRRKSRVRHPRRERRDCPGELLQTDATPFAWFGGSETFALHAMIDDATGKLTGLHMTANECAEGYFCVMKQTVQNYGCPRAVYADGLSLFFTKRKLMVEEELAGKQAPETQFASILRELGSNLIHARSPQAKGRVERLWETLQSRLPVEFAMRDISDMEAANAFLTSEYVQQFNNKFSVPPTNPISSFMPRPQGLALDTLLSLRYPRQIDRGGCFSLHCVTFACGTSIPPNAKIDVLINARIGVKVLYDGHLYTPMPILDKRKNQATGASVQAIIAQFVHDCCLRNEHAA